MNAKGSLGKITSIKMNHSKTKNILPALYLRRRKDRTLASPTFQY